MRNLLTQLSLTLPLAILFPLTAINGANSTNQIDKLVEGNQRYVNSTTVCHDDWSAKRIAQAKGQAPFAIIVTCSDSRVPPEIIFDQALGDLFVVRVAGNVVDNLAIGSIEFGVTVLGANTILVLGHSSCGAVDGALHGLKFDNHIQDVINAIMPAIKPNDSLEKATKDNVAHVEEILRNSKPVLNKLVSQGKLSIYGGYYDLASGKVDFLDKK